MVKKDSSARYTEMNAKIGSIGLLEGAQVVKTAIQLIK
jgi:2,3-bisphosphoglycerate-independent phosphoglycerate mutase